MINEAFRLRPGDELEIVVTDLAREGRGVGRASGLVVFVAGGLPGETLRVRVRRMRRGLAEAETLTILHPSPDRVVPPCAYFAACGGCDRQHMAPQAQAAWRSRQVAAVIQRVGGIDDPPVRPTETPSEPWGYRFRMDFDWRPGPAGPILGLHHRDRPGEVVPMDRCLLAGPQANAILEWLPQAARRLGLAAFDPVRRRGLLRRLSVQEARGTRETLVTLETGRGDPPELMRLAAALVDRIRGLVGIVRSELARDGRPLAMSILAGRDYLHELLEGDLLRVPCEAFFQPNPIGSLAVRRRAVEALDLRAGGTLLELYGGVGFFTVAAARSGADVVVIESSAPACAAGRANLEASGAANVRFVHGDVARALPAWIGERRDAVLLDPPRTGLAPGVARALAGSRVPRIVYVSCDPATLARDLRVLVGEGRYVLEEVTPFEIFAQTQHVESVAVLRSA